MQQMFNVEMLLQRFSLIRKAYAKNCIASMPQYNFSPNEIDILIFLSNNRTIDTASELSIYLNISKALVCRSVERLDRCGLIGITADEHDKRIRHLILLDDSLGIVREIEFQKARFSNIIVEDIDKADIEHMLHTMERIYQNIITKGNDEHDGK